MLLRCSKEVVHRQVCCSTGGANKEAWCLDSAAIALQDGLEVLQTGKQQLMRPTAQRGSSCAALASLVRLDMLINPASHVAGPRPSHMAA